MRTTINHALDILEEDEQARSDANRVELDRVIRRVQTDYQEIIENALSLLVQHKDSDCQDYLNEERSKLVTCKERIGGLIGDEARWPNQYHRDVIEYLYTRARLVDEIRMFPNFALELLERMTLDQSLAETINWLENAMTGRKDLYNNLVSEEGSK
ncbi:MAG: hypothetical protein HOC70_06765 [Gammaproteobacteria bacterium]|jgi:hypothetical protein|nr:hypothetical protein [Gammaproteobacteria bacterium]MBT7369777.1 hypothetical protein [Gammaproteobacteria bacterium]